MTPRKKPARMLTPLDPSVVARLEEKLAWASERPNFEAITVDVPDLRAVLAWVRERV